MKHSLFATLYLLCIQSIVLLCVYNQVYGNYMSDLPQTNKPSLWYLYEQPATSQDPSPAGNHHLYTL